MTVAYDTELVWIVVVGFIVAFVMAFGIGANDVANSFGTSVGSGVLTIVKACVLATIFEISGAVLIGHEVSATMTKKVIDVTLYAGSEKELMLGCLSGLAGSGLWLLIATALKSPISGTHATMGAIIGYSLVCRGADGIKWVYLGKIAASWFLSPVLSGLVSSSIFWMIRKFIIKTDEPVKRALFALPFIYSLTVAINMLSIILDGPKFLQVDKSKIWVKYLVTIVLGLLVGGIVYFFVTRRYKSKLNESGSKSIEKGDKNDNKSIKIDDNAGEENISLSPVSLPIDDNVNESNKTPIDVESNDKEDAKSIELIGPTTQQLYSIFTFLQILTACFASFAHGGNDVANAVGLLTGLWETYKTGSVSTSFETHTEILFFGGVGISVGLWAWGRRVIQTVGQEITKITPISGFTIEIGAALTVLLASKFGLPISTTHCKIGSIVFVGWSSLGKKSVSWSVFRNIAFAWLITVPIAGLFSAGFMFLFKYFALK